MTAAPNQAIIEIDGWQTADYTITASYFGDILDRASTGELPFSVLPARANTTIAYTGDTTVELNHAATFAATVTDGTTGLPLAGRDVTFTVGSQTCTATSDGDGNATCSFLVTHDPGDTTVSVSVPEDLQTLAASLNVDFTVILQATTVSAGYEPSPTTTVLTAALRTDTGAPIASAPVTLALGSQTCTAVTDVHGNASCSVATLTGPPIALTATFAGDARYLPSADSKTVTLSAKLVGGTGTGTPLSGRQVTFTLGSQSCNATTGSTGVATCWILLLQQPATYPLTVAFAGGSGYQASTTTSSFAVTKQETTVYVGVSGPLLNTNRLTLTGALVEDVILPISGRTLTMSLGSLSCTGVTNILGIASCTLPSTAPLGPTTSTVTFAGDAWYQPATKSDSVLLYAHAPGGGSFVVGDRSATGSVMFWGAQWSKNNSMSGSKPPSSFKGYANHGVTCVGQTWTADPGNSSTPPSGAPPTYMDVVVSSSASKSGSTISGNTVHIIVVKTDPGYAGNPGHDGTGTVVATISEPLFRALLGKASSRRKGGLFARKRPMCSLERGSPGVRTVGGAL